jgi:hypothetical protein
MKRALPSTRAAHPATAEAASPSTPEVAMPSRRSRTRAESPQPIAERLDTEPPPASAQRPKAVHPRAEGTPPLFEMDRVEYESEQSFPASDPPGWIGAWVR